MFYQELSRGENILNPSMNIHNPVGYSSLEVERLALGEKILERNYAPVAQEYLKKGCPRSLRAKMWALILGAEIRQHVGYYGKLSLINLPNLTFSCCFKFKGSI